MIEIMKNKFINVGAKAFLKLIINIISLFNNSTFHIELSIKYSFHHTF